MTRPDLARVPLDVVEVLRGEQAVLAADRIGAKLRPRVVPSPFLPTPAAHAEIVFEFHALGAEPISFRNDYVGAHNEVYAYDDAGRRTDVYVKRRAESVRENVYDSATGRPLLIPQATTLIGVYDSVVAFGQERLLVAWKRLIQRGPSTVP